MHIITLARDPVLTNDTIDGIPGRRLSNDDGLLALVERELITRPYSLEATVDDKKVSIPLVVARFLSKQGHDSTQLFYEVQEQKGPERYGGFVGYFMRDGTNPIRIGEKQVARAFFVFPGMNDMIYRAIFDVLRNVDPRLFAYEKSAEIKYPFELHGVQLKVETERTI